jgi:hypothetical protein
MRWEGDYPSMKVFSIAKGFYKLSKSAPPELSQKEFDRLRAITIWHETRDIGLVCQTFGNRNARFPTVFVEPQNPSRRRLVGKIADKKTKS